MLPFIAAHGLVIDPIFQETWTRSSFQDIIEPLINDRMNRHVSYAINSITGKNIVGETLRAKVTVRPNKQIMLRFRIILQVLPHVIQGAYLPTIIITCSGKYRYGDLRKIFFIRDHILPIGIVSGVLKPAAKHGVRVAYNTVDLWVSRAQRKPFLLHFIPFIIPVIFFI